METHQHITLSELLQQVKGRMENAFPLPMWIVAEISECKQNSYSGHCYLELIEKGGENGVPRAKAQANIWRNNYNRLAPYFESRTGQRLGVGIRIMVRVVVTFHEMYGFSLQITDIDPSYTIGEAELMRKQTIAQLQKDGVWDMNRELPLPEAPQRIAVVSAAQAAGFQDFCKHIEASPYRIEIELFEAFMQGNGAEDSIIEAMERVDEREEEFDLVVVIRGGGSQSDLSCFNSYRLCSHIAQFPLPVITGIGHDKDESIADMVASVTLKTPTATADWIVEQLAEIDNQLDSQWEELMGCTDIFFREEQQRIERNGSNIAMTAEGLTRRLEVRLERLLSDITNGAQMLLSGQEHRLTQVHSAVSSLANSKLERETSRLSACEGIIQARNPEQILKLGFSVVRLGGHSVRDASSLTKGEQIDIQLARGSVSATVE